MSIRKPFTPQVENDLGIGNQLTSPYRMLDSKGEFRVKRKGRFYFHPYQYLLEISWLKFHLLIFLFYAVINALFATIYYMIGAEALSGEYYGSFFPVYGKCYFFSVQTLTTVGYGSVAPMCFGSNITAAIEALVGLLIFALVTGLYYAKFTRPQARILFSKNVNISPYRDGVNGLMLRIVNQQSSQLIDIEAQITFSWAEKDAEGIKRRRYQGLPLERAKVLIFPLNWTIVHPITPESPFFNKSLEQIKGQNMELLVYIKAYDVVFGHQVQASISYQDHELLWAKKFVPMYFADEKEGSVLEMDKMDTVVDAALFPYENN